MLFNLESQKWTELQNGRHGYQIWSRDSKYIYYLHFSAYVKLHTSDYVKLVSYKVRIADHKLERVADFMVHKELFGTWSGLAPDGSPLFVRDISSEEIYALDVDLP